MQTRDHRKLAELLIAEMGENIPYRYKKVFVLGSIEPDINPFTYLHGLTWGEKLQGHNYENTLVAMKKLLDSMQRREGLGIWKYYHLGKLTHYVADAFTFPHNRKFCGSLKEHRRYEKKLHDQFSDVLQKQTGIREGSKRLNSFHQIEVLHNEYLEKAGTCDIDCRYILQAVASLLRGEMSKVWYTDLIPIKELGLGACFNCGLPQILPYGRKCCIVDACGSGFQFCGAGGSLFVCHGKRHLYELWQKLDEEEG